MCYKSGRSGTTIALKEVTTEDARGGGIMKGLNNFTRTYQRFADPIPACPGITRARVAEVMTDDAIPVRQAGPAGGNTARVRRLARRPIKYTKRGPVGIIAAQVDNIGDVFDEIDAQLERIERDEEVRVVAIYTLSGLFATLSIR
jgi:hypothetical protein